MRHAAPSVTANDNAGAGRLAALYQTVGELGLRPRRRSLFERQCRRLSGRARRILYGRGLVTSGKQIDLAHFHSERVPYEPSGWRYLRRGLRGRRVTTRDVFIDFGSGKGRIVYQAAKYPFSRVIGIEISEELNEVARMNLDRAQKRLRCQRVELVTADAAEFDVPDDVTIAYFYYPFSGKTFRTVVDRIVDSLERRPRHMTLIYACPKLQDVVLDTGRFRLARTARGWPRDLITHRVAVFESIDTGVAVRSEG